MRHPPLVLALALSAAPALAAGVSLPPTLLGTYAPDAAACADRDGAVVDSRVAVTALSFETFASAFTVAGWRRVGDVYRGSAEVAEEGEGEPLPGRVELELRPLADGGLEVRIGGGEAAVYRRCPDGVPLR